ncbi:hypothetical protein C8Q80DRAFT_1097109 [Daedaleopsis nitida]|nr:hypothetical protein C8Q80DRAFT_1097109 [Daedaleopsis nitida]
MTDFASQGQTQPFNVCDLQNCRTHQSVYTCLSRGSTLDGTIIVQAFDSNKLTGGIAGSLRQKFRELELLDEITKLRYLGRIPPHVIGITRNELIHLFRCWKGETFVPKTIHSAIKWSNKNPFPLNPVTVDSLWTLIKQSKADADASKQAAMKRDTGNFVVAKGTQALNNVSNAATDQSIKRKHSMEEDEIDNTLKEKGIPWDKDNWSCAYDSMLTILLSMYIECSKTWKTEASSQSNVFLKLEQVYQQSPCTLPTMTVVQARNHIRDMLGCENPELAARGKTYTDVYE